mgnify:CR=1 FL=1
MAEYQIGFGKAAMPLRETDLPLGEFDQIDTPLMTRCIWLKGPQSVTIISFELTALRPETVERLKDQVAQALNCSREQVWITVTHSFSSPHIPSVASKDPHRNQVMQQALTQSLNEALVLAQQDLQTFEFTQQTMTCPLNVNRNVETEAGWWLGANFNGYSNHDLRLLVFKQANGHVGLVINYDLQASVLDHLQNAAGTRTIDHDLVGRASALIEAAHPGWLALFITGAAGDQMPLWQGKTDQAYVQNVALCQSQAEVLQTCVLQGLATADADDWRELTHFSTQEVVFQVPQQVRQMGTFELKPTHHFDFVNNGKTIALTLSAWRFNEVLLLATQPELNSQFADKCRQVLQTPHALIATLVNGAAKYLPTTADYQNCTYQAMNADIGVGGEAAFMQAIKKIKEG